MEINVNVSLLLLLSYTVVGEGLGGCMVTWPSPMLASVVVVLQSSAGFWIHERLLCLCVCVCKENVKIFNLALIMRLLVSGQEVMGLESYCVQDLEGSGSHPAVQSVQSRLFCPQYTSRVDIMNHWQPVQHVQHWLLSQSVSYLKTDSRTQKLDDDTIVPTQKLSPW